MKNFVKRTLVFRVKIFWKNFCKQLSGPYSKKDRGSLREGVQGRGRWGMVVVLSPLKRESPGLGVAFPFPKAHPRLHILRANWHHPVVSDITCFTALVILQHPYPCCQSPYRLPPSRVRARSATPPSHLLYYLQIPYQSIISFPVFSA